MQRKFWPKKQKIYMIGLGGVSMSALAACLLSAGFTVAGSDVCRSERTAALEERGVDFVCGHDPARAAAADAVVVSSAVPDNDPELAAARSRGVPVYDRADLLARIVSGFEVSVGVAGCHGKTTATAMCAHVLQACGGCTAHIGGDDLDFGSYFEGGNRIFVTEVCEYRGNIRKIHPTIAVVLNTDVDHLECYGSAAALFDAYAAYARSAPAAVVCGDDPIRSAVRPALTFGLSEGCDVRALRLRSSGGRYSFTLSIRGQPCGRVRLNVYGRHNVRNALAAAAVAEQCGFPPSLTAAGLAAFHGIRRRFERLGKLYGAELIADYAHHPREIAAALETAREAFGGRLFVIFQPHTYSRTRLLFDDFVSVLQGVEQLVIYKTYPAREYFDAAGSALALAEKLPNALYIETLRELSVYLRCSLRAGDTALFLGAGDIYFAAKRLLGAKL